MRGVFNLQLSAGIPSEEFFIELCRNKAQETMANLTDFGLKFSLSWDFIRFLGQLP